MRSAEWSWWITSQSCTGSRGSTGSRSAPCKQNQLPSTYRAEVTLAGDGAREVAAVSAAVRSICPPPLAPPQTSAGLGFWPVVSLQLRPRRGASQTLVTQRPPADCPVQAVRPSRPQRRIFGSLPSLRSQMRRYVVAGLGANVVSRPAVSPPARCGSVPYGAMLLVL